MIRRGIKILMEVKIRGIE
jgi:hypothetical protein